MPFVDDAEPAGLAPQIAEPLKMPGEPGWREGRDITVPVPSFGSLVEAAWTRGSTLGSLREWTRQEPMAPFDASFDPFKNIAGYEENARAFIGANDEIDVMHVKTRIDDERRRRERLDAGGWWGLLAELGAGLLDPINLIPVGGQVVAATRAGRTLQGALRVGATGAVSTAAQEGVLQATQIDRPPSESVFNVAAATFVGSPIGGLVGFFGPDDSDGGEDAAGEDEDAAEDDGQDEGAAETTEQILKRIGVRTVEQMEAEEAEEDDDDDLLDIDDYFDDFDDDE